MPPLATIGSLIEVTPWDDLQYWPDANTISIFIDDRTPFYFRVAGELIDDGCFFGLHGRVESGPVRCLDLVCNIMVRHDDSDWHKTSECGASFKVAPSIAQRVGGYRSADHSDVPFFLHPEGTFVEGYPRTSRFGGIQVADDSDMKNHG